MRNRVFGIETEYAVIYHPGRRETARPTNLEIYQLFESLLGRHVRCLPRAFSLLRSKPGRFLENGASFHYEATPKDFEHGLIEMASPECRDPFTLLSCERAKDQLVETLCSEVNQRLPLMGYSGEIRIGKNNVDSQGNTFGSHENYWVEDPLSSYRKLLLLPLWMGLWILSIPVFAWLLLVMLAFIGAMLVLFLLPVVGALLAGFSTVLSRAHRRSALGFARAAARLAETPKRLIGSLQSRPGEAARRLTWIELPLRPVISLHSWMHNRFHFRRFHRQIDLDRAAVAPTDLPSLLDAQPLPLSALPPASDRLPGDAHPLRRRRLRGARWRASLPPRPASPFHAQPGPCLYLRRESPPLREPRFVLPPLECPRLAPPPAPVDR
jgi:hypothetical protein